VPIVGRILLHPIKALDPIAVPQSAVLASGALEFDRRWAVVDGHGQFVSGKTRAVVHHIRAEYDLARLEVALDGHVFSLERQRTELARWMSERIGDRVELRENGAAGFPDDTASPGPTFVSEGSLAVVADWFGWPLAEARLRFRTNVELEGTGPFWEDRLYGRVFRASSVHVHAVNPCARCVVPSRDPRTGEPTVGFQRRFAELREAHLPPHAQTAAFDHHYRFAVNTRIPPTEAGKIVRVGDETTDSDG